MVDNRRNSNSGIFVLLLMFILLSFLHEKKESKITGTTMHSCVIPGINGSGLQAIPNPAISAPGINLFRTSTLNTKCAYVDCTSSREFIFNKLVSSYFSCCQLKFHYRNPILSLFFLRKVPGQGKEDDIVSIT